MMEYSEGVVKHEEEEAPAAAAEIQVQSVCKDEEPELARAGVNWWCRGKQRYGTLATENQRYLYPYEQRGDGDVFQDGESDLETAAKTFDFSKLLLTKTLKSYRLVCLLFRALVLA